jgi:hypothetical protein
VPSGALLQFIAHAKNFCGMRSWIAGLSEGSGAALPEEFAVSANSMDVMWRDLSCA